MTAYDDGKNIIGSMRPNENWSIYSGVLNVIFSIPSNASYVVIHTKQEYLYVTLLDGTEGGLSPAMSYSSNSIGVAMGGVFGGAIGGAIAGLVASNSSYNKAQPDYYVFGPGGVFDIHLLNCAAQSKLDGWQAAGWLGDCSSLKYWTVSFNS